MLPVPFACGVRVGSTGSIPTKLGKFSAMPCTESLIDAIWLCSKSQQAWSESFVKVLKVSGPSMP
jgi:hypothetical protein